jgi:hypothetical protein
MSVRSPKRQTVAWAISVFDPVMDEAMLKSRWLTFFGVLSAGLTLGPTALSAATIYSQNWMGSFNGPASGPVDSQQIADNFSISNNASILSLSWGELVGLDSIGALQNDFTIRLYSNTNTPPGQAYNLNISPALNPFYEAAVTAQRSPTGNMNGQYSIFQFEASLPIAVPLLANTTYWLSIMSDTPTVPAGESGWFWVNSTLGGNNVFRPCCNLDGTQWLENVNGDHSDLTFALYDNQLQPAPGPIPGAGLLSYIALGLLGVGSAAWKRLQMRSV